MDEIDDIKKLAQSLEERAKKVQKSLEESSQQVQKEKEQWEVEKQEMAAKFAISENILDLNVGGKELTTYKSVLCKQPGSLLEAMFSGRHPIAKDSKGRFFIDVNGVVFEHILDFLRTGIYIPPDSPEMKKKVRSLSEYLGITLGSPHLDVDSKILQDKALQDLFHQVFPDVKDIKLPYQASRDGWSAQNFHQKCDNILGTVTLVQVGKNVFGGYTNSSWKGGGGYVCDGVSFLFSLRNPTDTHVGKRFPNHGSEGQQSIFSRPSYGPTFGGGHDLHIAANANTSTISYTNFGHSYSHPTLQNGTQEIQTFFCGSYNFTPTEVEVFSIQLN
eukprot:TRINITY_DN790_c0_g1_i3.p1 TRINITY_DN790_c0_g1~~TRINITY_DN790_c0_g1_i3.p1  ORF type:complete len:343 (+),score=100.80 TRINITY_DN790_c0_g1_i3:37-1029(+)